MDRRFEFAGIILLIGVAIIVNTLFVSARSSDLLATWIAGQMFAAEQFSEIYMTSEPVFTMTPPDSWSAFMAKASGYEDALFPYLYPPLWAWVASLLGDISFESIKRVATLLNAGLLSGCVFLGYRITRAPVNLLVFCLITLPFLYLTPIGAVAMFENQPQILVCFLLLLTLERLRAQDETTAGIALAIAAALKIYPAFFAVFFLASRNKRAFVSFVVAGGLLGLLSVFVAGWPLHQEFLTTAETAAGTTIISSVNYSIHGSLAQIFAKDDLVAITMTGGGEINGQSAIWHIYAKSALWNSVGTLCLLATIGVLWWMQRTSTQAQRFEIIWPITFLFVPLLSPFGWAYYFIAPVVLVPVLFRRLPNVICWIALSVIFALTALPMQKSYRTFFDAASAGQIAATFAVIVLTALFLFTLRRKASR